MLRSHRSMHRIVWIALAVLLPLVCGYALWFRAPANSTVTGPQTGEGR